MDTEREATSKAQDLFKQSLHKSTEILTSLYLPSASAHTLLLHADSIVKQQPHRSLPFYERAIKSLKGEWLVQVQARYVDACISSQEFYKAKTMVSDANQLESIAVADRTTRILYQLAIVYDHFGELKNSTECYKAVLRNEPMAIQVIFKLLEHGSSFKELQPLINDPFVEKYAKAQHQMHTHHLNESLATFRELEDTHRNNVYILSSIAEVYYRSGDFYAARDVYSKIRRLEPEFIEGMDIFAYILSQQGDFNTLDRLELKIPLIQTLKFHMKGEHEKAVQFEPVLETY